VQRGVALAFLAASVVYLALAMGFPFGTLARPGAGFFPVGVGVFLCAAALTVVAAGFRRVPAAAPPLAPESRRRVAVTGAALAAFCLLVPWLGYPACAFLFVMLVLRRLGGGRWLSVLIIAALSAAISYYVFASLLSVPLPRGVWMD
jgi:putative tricarboxylic transport membrane protein